MREIAFVSNREGNREIYVMSALGDNVRPATRNRSINAFPSWAPNGRVIMFFRQPRGGSPLLFSIDLTGRNERPMATPLGASDPAWSPLLP